jgi:hypothetical protein
MCVCLHRVEVGLTVDGSPVSELQGSQFKRREGIKEKEERRWAFFQSHCSWSSLTFRPPISLRDGKCNEGGREERNRFSVIPAAVQSTGIRLTS